MSILRPDRYGNWDWKHGKSDDGESRNGENKIPYEPMEHPEMLATQRKLPLEPQ
jgi:hypothetical protein